MKKGEEEKNWAGEGRRWRDNDFSELVDDRSQAKGKAVEATNINVYRNQSVYVVLSSSSLDSWA